MLKKLWPNIMVADVAKTIDFYEQILGFGMVMAVPADSQDILFQRPEGRSLVYALIKRGDVEMMFQERVSLAETVPCFDGVMPGTAALTFYFSVEDIEALRQRIEGKAEVVKDLHDTFYGMREFYIRDCNGYVLGFSQPLATNAPA